MSCGSPYIQTKKPQAVANTIPIKKPFSAGPALASANPGLSRKRLRRNMPGKHASCPRVQSPLSTDDGKAAPIPPFHSMTQRLCAWMKPETHLTQNIKKWSARICARAESQCCQNLRPGGRVQRHSCRNTIRKQLCHDAPTNKQKITNREARQWRRFAQCQRI